MKALHSFAILAFFVAVQCFSLGRGLSGVNVPLLKVSRDGLNSSPRKVVNPPMSKTFLEKLTFGWVDRIMSLGKSGHILLKDLPSRPESEQVSNMTRSFRQSLVVPVNATMPSTRPQKKALSEIWNSPLTHAIARNTKMLLIKTGILKFFNTAVQFVPPILVSRILKLVERQKSISVGTLTNQGVFYVFLLLLMLSTKTVIENHYFDISNTNGANIRAVLSQLVYDKALRLSHSGRQNSTVGEVLNLMQLDTSRVESLVTSVHLFWDGLFQIVGYTALLLLILGPSVFAGLGAMMIIIPLNAILFKRLSKLRTEGVQLTDSRLRLTNEILHGARAIKLYGWEKPFLTKLADIRNAELKTIEKSANTKGLAIAILSVAPSLVAMSSLSIYALLGHTLTASNVFTALALFHQLRFPLIFLPMLMTTASEGRISLRRLLSFLRQEEVQDYVSHAPTAPYAVQIVNGSFCWDSPAPAAMNSKDDARSRLEGVNLSVKQGELVAIIGTVGSGKTTLLSAILGEPNLLSGNVSVAGKVALVPQTAWMPNDTVRNVILFGRPMDEMKYREVLRVSGLMEDLSKMDLGDETEVGDRGSNLSGGQRQRVSLARALYDDAEVYLLDDPLSALDATVSNQVFKNALKDYLAKKTRVLVTHQLSLLPLVDRIVIMTTEGQQRTTRILDQGTFRELLSRGHDLSRMVSSEEVKEKKGNDDKRIDEEFEKETSSDELDEHGDKLQQITATKDSPSITAIKARASLEANYTSTIPQLSPSEVFSQYFKMTKKPSLLLWIAVSLALANVGVHLQQWIVAAWTSDIGHRRFSMGVYVGGIAVACVFATIFHWARTYLGVLLGLAASKNLHEELSTKLLGAPVGYFESTPLGRLLQRFSKDFDSIDMQIPNSMGQLFSGVFSILGSLFSISLSSPSFVVIMGPLLMVYILLTNYYREVARELKRLESRTRSGLYSHFSESLSGLAVIRAFERTESFRKSNEAKLDDNLAVIQAGRAVERWLSVRLEFLGNIIVALAALLAVVYGAKAGATGISLNSALGMTGLLNWAVRNGVETESLMNSVERVISTTSHIPRESNSFVAHVNVSLQDLPNATASPSNVKDVRSALYHKLQNGVHNVSDTDLLTSGWPWLGSIRFENVIFKYRNNLSPALQNLTLTVNPGEMIGVVGRSGSGKSTLIQALLRLVELESGKITIDGVDAGAVGLNTLRSCVAVIPQEPILFSGSIRSNLDPLERFSDDAIWEALRKAHADEIVASLPCNLGYVCGESGDNFSAGQRQLLCLARALLRRNKIVILDEATSSIDRETDQLVQDTIRREFGEGKCTVLIIAHRLESLLNVDKILVMDRGRLDEFGSPKALLSNKKGSFSQLLKSEREMKAKTAAR